MYSTCLVEADRTNAEVEAIFGSVIGFVRDDKYLELRSNEDTSRPPSIVNLKRAAYVIAAMDP